MKNQTELQYLSHLNHHNHHHRRQVLAIDVSGYIYCHPGDLLPSFDILPFIAFADHQLINIIIIIIIVVVNTIIIVITIMMTVTFITNIIISLYLREYLQTATHFGSSSP